jgi:hypothetical protein
MTDATGVHRGVIVADKDEKLGQPIGFRTTWSDRTEAVPPRERAARMRSPSQFGAWARLLQP